MRMLAAWQMRALHITFVFIHSHALDGYITVTNDIEQQQQERKGE
jgi:hypothetical protein